MRSFLKAALTALLGLSWLASAGAQQDRPRDRNAEKIERLERWLTNIRGGVQ